MEGKEYYQFLLNRYLNGLATEPEQEELFSELQKRKDDKEWEDLLHELIINHQKTTEYDEAEWEPVIGKILERGKQKNGLVRTMPSWKKMSAAAIFILTLTTAIFLLVNKKKTGKQEIASSPKTSILNHIAPGGDRAILTLALPVAE